MNTLIHEEKYRGQGLLQKMADQSIIVCGAGAIGSNLIENMVRQGFKKITVIDKDRVEEHNRHTQIYDRRDVGQLKVASLKSRIFNIMGVTLEIESKELTAQNVGKLLKAGSIVIDGFDNSASRGIITQYCLQEGLQCLHAGLSKDYAEVIWNQFYHVPKPSTGVDICEYPLARNVALLASTVATEVLIRYLDKGVFENYTVTLGDFKICPL